MCASLVIASGKTAAGGGGSASGGSTNPAYELIGSTADKTSVLSGSALQANNSNVTLKLTTIKGSLKHDSKATVVEDGTYTLTDKNGPNKKDIVGDGISALTYKGSFTGNYNYANSFVQSYSVAGTNFDSIGIIGIATKSADMPTSDSATYKGEAEAVVVHSSGGFDLKSGISNVKADFGASKASITLNGFTSIDQSTGKPGAAPIDEIKITDIAISGSGFSGGSFATSKNGTAVDIVGANAKSQSISNFFGLNAKGDAPSEVGGHVLMEGKGGLVSGSYIAQQ